MGGEKGGFGWDEGGVAPADYLLENDSEQIIYWKGNGEMRTVWVSISK